MPSGARPGTGSQQKEPWFCCPGVQAGWWVKGKVADREEEQPEAERIEPSRVGPCSLVARVLPPGLTIQSGTSEAVFGAPSNPEY